jgi:hypothetical protein
MSGTTVVSASIDMTAFSDGDWASSIVTPTVLSASTTYAIQCQETAGGNTWHNVSTFSLASVAGTVRARYASSSGATWADVDYIPDYMYVPTTLFFQ